MKTTRSKDGTKLAYDVTGKGPALIYITGATCYRQFNPVLYDVSVFSEEFTVYNYDRRGRGDSGNTLPYAVEREVEDIEAMIDAAGGQGYLYGHSSGAILALKAAMALGSKVTKLVIYDAAYSHNKAYLEEFKGLSSELYQLLDEGKNQEAITGFLEGIGIPQEAFDSFYPDWSAMVALAPTLAYDTTLASTLAPVNELASLTTPTQIIVGEKSPESIQEVALQLKAAIPHAAYTLLKGQDHMPAPEVVLSVLTHFLKS
ncbi:Pimeloyl-ACP methyl ester carboxylesterase [Chitinophaga eiseniae]|uniref:Pimeloyl-ACP methyl ester carboxylesterase n=1 Tax=Chitinophaga eiseniae TaxID=634771 RepID=A0A1T4SWP4_9BACT|nr:alpha/beta hydrolase [Chitinophaga eiseniae]SKA32338.1 Pimeloyl-ACP methyl ester carboxylesterase [Chitinophaga eiseniae]